MKRTRAENFECIDNVAKRSRISDEDLTPELVPDVLEIIFTMIRKAGLVYRANLRRVSKQLHEKDKKFTPPSWVHTHEDLKTLPPLAYHYFTLFVSDVCEADKWGVISRPLEIRWDTRARNELRLLFSRTLYWYDILHITELHYGNGDVGMYYVQGSTRDKESDYNEFYDEYMGTGTSKVQHLNWTLRVCGHE